MSVQKELERKIKEQQDKKYHVLFVPTLSSAIAFYRMEQFVNELRKDPDMSIAYTYHNPSYTDTCKWEWQLARDPELLKEFEKICECADLIVFQALHSRDSASLLNAIKDKYRIPILSEFDDDPFSLPASHPSYDVISPGSSAEAYSNNQIENSDALVVTNEYLKKAFKAKNPNCYIMPNSINFDIWDNLKEYKRTDNTIRIGYTGGANHLDDIELIYEPMKEILKRHKNVRFVLYYGGEVPIKFRMKGVIIKDFRHWAPINEYPQKLKSMKFDIGLTPLRDRQFNRCKSNVKYLEYSAMGIPTISSPVEPYKKNVGLFAKSKKDWIATMETLIESEETRRTLGRQAYEDVKQNYNVLSVSKRYGEMLKGLINKNKGAKI